MVYCKCVCITLFGWSMTPYSLTTHGWLNCPIMAASLSSLYLLSSSRLWRDLTAALSIPWGGAGPLSLVDHPKLPFAQLLSKGDALGLQLKGVFGSLPHLSLDSTKSRRWCPVLVILHLIATLEHCILLHNI